MWAHLNEPFIFARYNIDMNILYEKIQTDLKTAMVSGNKIKRDVLRTIISDIKNMTVNAGKELTDDICLIAIKRSVKQHNDSVESFKQGKREDLALKEMEELAYIEGYLPKMLPDVEICALIDCIIADQKIEKTKKNFGSIMKLLNSHTLKDQIDKKVASQYLNKILK